MTSVVLGVSGGIAAYKACELLRRFTEGGAAVDVVPTAAALRFVGSATWEALSGRPIAGLWRDAAAVPHVSLARGADLVVVAPATADVMAKAAAGIADDLLTNVLLMARCPVVFAPAMHTEMWEHPATRANVETLRARGVVVLEPAVGRLTGADSGPGRLPEAAEIHATCRSILARNGPGPGQWNDLAGRTVVVSAGGTREPLDPVRFLGNRSTGLQGYALARAAAGRGARVVLVAANVELADPAGVSVVPVATARELRAAVVEASTGADAVVMAAAVADFRPAEEWPGKMKKDALSGPPAVQLTENPDVLAELARSRADGQVIVGFAAETDDVLAAGRAKLARKGCDLLVVNAVGDGKGFGTPDNAAVILGADGSEVDVPLGPKDRLAHVVWDCVLRRWDDFAR